ncbi:MAG: hypothetical protein P4L35_06160, partial [Ignavibacteriaceae bacterium]|nr:hypothetical protein [Ignavibacteriaceae bacterium]
MRLKKAYSPIFDLFRLEANIQFPALSLNVVAVTERFILRFPASAKRYSVPDLVQSAIFGFYLDAAANPERA